MIHLLRAATSHTHHLSINLSACVAIKDGLHVHSRRCTCIAARHRESMHYGSARTCIMCCTSSRVHQVGRQKVTYAETLPHNWVCDIRACAAAPPSHMRTGVVVRASFPAQRPPFDRCHTPGTAGALQCQAKASPTLSHTAQRQQRCVTQAGWMMTGVHRLVRYRHGPPACPTGCLCCWPHAAPSSLSRARTPPARPTDRAARSLPPRPSACTSRRATAWAMPE